MAAPQTDLILPVLERRCNSWPMARSVMVPLVEAEGLRAFIMEMIKHKQRCNCTMIQMCTELHLMRSDTLCTLESAEKEKMKFTFQLSLCVFLIVSSSLPLLQPSHSACSVACHSSWKAVGNSCAYPSCAWQVYWRETSTSTPTSCLI